MKKNYFMQLLVILGLAFVSCSSDFDEDTLEKSTSEDHGIMYDSKKKVKTKSLLSVYDGVYTWSGSRDVAVRKNIKIAFSSAYMAYIQSGIYACAMYIQ